MNKEIRKPSDILNGLYEALDLYNSVATGKLIDDVPELLVTDNELDKEVPLENLLNTIIIYINDNLATVSKEIGNQNKLRDEIKFLREATTYAKMGTFNPVFKELESLNGMFSQSKRIKVSNEFTAKLSELSTNKTDCLRRLYISQGQGEISVTIRSLVYELVEHAIVEAKSLGKIELNSTVTAACSCLILVNSGDTIEALTFVMSILNLEQ